MLIPRMFFFEEITKLDYPCGQSLEEIDKKYLDTFTSKMSDLWYKKFNAQRSRTLTERTRCGRYVSNDFKETAIQNVGKELIDCTGSIAISPEEFGKRPSSKLTSGEKRGRRSYVTSGCQVGFCPIYATAIFGSGATLID